MHIVETPRIWEVGTHRRCIGLAIVMQLVPASSAQVLVCLASIEIEHLRMVPETPSRLSFSTEHKLQFSFLQQSEGPTLKGRSKMWCFMRRGGRFVLGSEICINGDVGERFFYYFVTFGFTNISPFLQRAKNSKKNDDQVFQIDEFLFSSCFVFWVEYIGFWKG